MQREAEAPWGELVPQRHQLVHGVGRAFFRGADHPDHLDDGAAVLQGLLQYPAQLSGVLAERGVDGYGHHLLEPMPIAPGPFTQE